MSINNLIKIENSNQRVLTSNQLAELYESEPRRISENFNANKERYIEEEHYYLLEGEVLKQFKGEYGNSVVAQNINKLYLWTEKGALYHAKSLNTDKAWDTYDKLVESYFRYKQIVPNNEFDLMRMYVDQLEQMKYGMNKAIQTSNQALNKVSELENKVDVVIKNDYVKANDIARQLKLFTESKLPHSQLIGQIARKLGYKTDFKRHYQDEYIAITGDSGVYDVYYKPKAIEEIVNWFKKNKNKCYYEIFYKRDSKNNSKGDVREKGYKINGTHFKTT